MKTLNDTTECVPKGPCHVQIVLDICDVNTLEDETFMNGKVVNPFNSTGIAYIGQIYYSRAAIVYTHYPGTKFMKSHSIAIAPMSFEILVSKY